MSEEYTPFKMKGSPAKMGGIQGTSSHASALKQTTKSTDGTEGMPDEPQKPQRRMTKKLTKRDAPMAAEEKLWQRLVPGERVKRKATNWNEKLTKLTDKRTKLKEKQDTREDSGKGTKIIDWRVKRNQKKINKEMKKAGN
jgi:hypothetical protein